MAGWDMHVREMVLEVPTMTDTRRGVGSQATPGASVVEETVGNDTMTEAVTKGGVGQCTGEAVERGRPNGTAIGIPAGKGIGVETDKTTTANTTNLDPSSCMPITPRLSPPSGSARMALTSSLMTNSLGDSLSHKMN
jgi:hypothetical protein